MGRGWPWLTLGSLEIARCEPGAGGGTSFSLLPCAAFECRNTQLGKEDRSQKSNVHSIWERFSNRSNKAPPPPSWPRITQFQLRSRTGQGHPLPIEFAERRVTSCHSRSQYPANPIQIRPWIEETETLFSNGLKAAPAPNAHSASGGGFHFEVRFTRFHRSDEGSERTAVSVSSPQGHPLSIEFAESRTVKAWVHPRALRLFRRSRGQRVPLPSVPLGPCLPSFS